jgi:NTP pyrophosphatase (non-canonical NTP hydrolase)
VRFDTYQGRVSAAAEDLDPLTTLLGLGAHAGRLLEAHQRYLRDGIDAQASSELVRRELAQVLRHVALLATTHELSLDDVARRNIAKIRDRARQRDLPRAPDVPDGAIDAATYQRLATLTDEDAKDGVDPLALGVPMLGLAGEAGTLLVAQKKQFRDKQGEPPDPDFVAVELGDVLWYASTVARHAQLDLADLVDESLAQAEQRQHEQRSLTALPTDLPVLDAEYPDTERFPRRLLIRFQQQADDGRVTVRMTLVDAAPNAFSDGPIDIGLSKTQGFRIAGPIGDPLTDNSHRADDYRFHDAIHLGFLAVMGWSPNMRQLLGLKRRSDLAVDENEDGARAIFAEEGLAAVLAKRAPLMQQFRTESAVDDESIEMLTTVLEDLEVSRMPPWLWRRAIVQGFRAMRELAQGPGGFLVVDLDSRSLTYHKTPPRRY